MSDHVILQHRALIEVNTDPQRRCYNGVHAKSEIRWTEWSALDSFLPVEKADSVLKFWRELNDYAVSERGQMAKKEFRIIPKET